jgi:predicted DNA repair protein MutK
MVAWIGRSDKMISLPAALIIAGILLWALTTLNVLGIALLVIGLILAFVGYPAGWYGRRGAP